MDAARFAVRWHGLRASYCRTHQFNASPAKGCLPRHPIDRCAKWGEEPSGRVRYTSAMYREQEITFVYEHGVLRPEGPVDFPEGARGIANIREAPPLPLPARSDNGGRRAAIDAIHRIGESGQFNSGGQKLTRDQMHERG